MYHIAARKQSYKFDCGVDFIRVLHASINEFITLIASSSSGNEQCRAVQASADLMDLRLFIVRRRRNPVADSQLMCTCNHTSAAGHRKGNDARARINFMVTNTNGSGLAAPLAFAHYASEVNVELFMCRCKNVPMTCRQSCRGRPVSSCAVIEPPRCCLGREGGGADAISGKCFYGAYIDHSDIQIPLSTTRAKRATSGFDRRY